ncbi:MAG: metallophosphoesterase [Pseudomonadota bacterium]
MKTGKQNRPRARDGHRIYAIGDVHGCYDEMRRLLEVIEQDNQSRAPAKTFIIFLGDLIDRGPKSRQVLQYLIDTPPEFARMEVLKGNHEEMALQALLGDPILIPEWLKYGGFEFALSYGLEAETLNSHSPVEVQQLLCDAVPREHLEFLGTCVDWLRSGDYMFVHAGVRPGIPLDQQAGRDVRWIRAGFLDHTGSFGATIVHGHTISPSVEIKHNRIGLDTGAYKTGKLSAIRLEGQEWGVLSAEKPAGILLHR